MLSGCRSQNAVRKPSSHIRKVLANNVRAYRRKHGLSQEALADVCELHRTYVGAIERGERNVTLSTMEVLAKSLSASSVRVVF